MAVTTFAYGWLRERVFPCGLALVLFGCDTAVHPDAMTAPDLVVARGAPLDGESDDRMDAVVLHADVVTSRTAEALTVAEASLLRLPAEPGGDSVLIETEIDEHRVRAVGLKRGRYRLELVTDSMEEIEREFVVRPGDYTLRLRLQIAELGVVNGRIVWDGVPLADRPGAVLVQFESPATARWVIGGARRAVAMQSIDLRVTDRFVLEVPDEEARVRFHIVDPNWRGEVSTVASPGSPRDVRLVVRRR